VNAQARDRPCTRMPGAAELAVVCARSPTYKLLSMGKAVVVVSSLFVSESSVCDVL